MPKSIKIRWNSRLTNRVIQADNHMERLLKRLSTDNQSLLIVESKGKAIGAFISASLLERWKEREKLFTVFDRVRTRNIGVDAKEVEKDVTAAIRAVRRKK